MLFVFGRDRQHQSRNDSTTYFMELKMHITGCTYSAKQLMIRGFLFAVLLVFLAANISYPSNVEATQDKVIVWDG